jgi:O-antigen ligase
LTPSPVETADPHRTSTDKNGKPVYVLALFILAGLALLLAGALLNRQAYLTRGIPSDLPGPIAHGGPRPGLNVYLQGATDEQIAGTLSDIHALGVYTIKQTFNYQDSFDWTAADRLVNAAAAQGLELVPLLDGNPAQGYAPPQDTADFAAWAGEFAARYGQTVDNYIIWDEPNLAAHWGGQAVNANEYAALLSATAAAIRAADSSAVIVAAPLAPTTETGPKNLSDALYLQALYEAGAAEAFDVAAAKPYGFHSGPGDREVAAGRLNFSRAILLREVMARNGDEDKALWAGNWGWNSLPADWNGYPSIWGQVDEQTQAGWTVAALERARREWPWMGLMFLENWEPGAAATDPRWGFSVAGRPSAAALQSYLEQGNPGVAYPGFHPARAADPAQVYSGGWRFAPDYGADISQTADGAAPDSVQFTFWGTDVGLRVRRADFRARLYVTIDGQPANALPHDEYGAALVLTSPDPAEDYVTTELVARNLMPGKHVMVVTASRGWDQWALNGFSVGYNPLRPAYPWGLAGLLAAGVLLALGGVFAARHVDWGPFGTRVGGRFAALGDAWQLFATAVTAAIVALTGWLMWGEQLSGIYRRLGDGGQLALTATAASIFYVTPVFFIYILALLTLFVLIYLRPAWGLALVAFSFPFYVAQASKPILGYHFSPVELFMLVTTAATALRGFTAALARQRAGEKALPRPELRGADYAVLTFTAVATLSLLFTERLDVATNEWRMVILEPVLFYVVLRSIRPQEKEMWVILDAYILGGIAIALIGLGQYLTGSNLIAAEGGLMRLRSIYGSPNNVALYLGRIVPLLVAMLLLGQAADPRRRWAYAAALLPVGLALLLTFSRGGLLLGVPAGLLLVGWVWLRRRGWSPWPWIVGLGALATAAFLAAQRVPQLAGRLDLSSETGVFRINLWRSSLEMIREHPLFGVGLDNFLYAYRGRYILDAAWQEPNLNHPHNLFLDLATRIGLLGLAAGLWLFWEAGHTLWRVLQQVPGRWLPVAAGFSGALASTLAHGLVDHSFFLVDLAFSFFLLIGTAVWLDILATAPKIMRHS